MARLQILQLPEGAGDDRPPWLLIVDELPTRDAQLDMLRRDLADNDLTARIGARGALCFESTINLPANEPLSLPLMSVQGDSQTSELIDVHEQTRLALCDAFCLPLDSTWTQIVETAGQRQRSLAGLLRERDAPAPGLVALVRKTLGIDNVGPAGVPYDEALHNACRQLEKSEASRAHLRRERDQLKAALERVRNEPDEPEIMNAQEQHPTTWKHGYGCGVRAAKRAAAPRHDEPTVTVDVSLTGAQRRDVQKIVNETIRETSRAIRMQGWLA